MLAPELILYKYETTKPERVKAVASNELSIIILESLLQNDSAKYVGMVKSAMTKISPTTLIAATTVKAAMIKISV